MTPGPPPHHHADVGSLAEEAARLLGAAQDWARRLSADAPIATGAADCQWCPLCQAVALLRGDRPEITARLSETAAGLLELLRAAFVPPSDPPTRAASNPASSNPAPSNPAPSNPAPSNPAPSNPAPSAGSRTHRIDLLGPDPRS